MGNLPSELKNQIQDFSKTDFSKSDAWMGRTISSLVKVGWTAAQVEERAQKMVKHILEGLNS
jgi:8-amino-3,8-dideoxy-alpha-D-manno-octulosonate transaminase